MSDAPVRGIQLACARCGGPLEMRVQYDAEPNLDRWHVVPCAKCTPVPSFEPLHCDRCGELVWRLRDEAGTETCAPCPTCYAPVEGSAP